MHMRTHKRHTCLFIYLFYFFLIIKGAKASGSTPLVPGGSPSRGSALVPSFFCLLAGFFFGGQGRASRSVGWTPPRIIPDPKGLQAWSLHYKIHLGCTAPAHVKLVGQLLHHRSHFFKTIRVTTLAIVTSDGKRFETKRFFSLFFAKNPRFPPKKPFFPQSTSRKFYLSGFLPVAPHPPCHKRRSFFWIWKKKKPGFLPKKRDFPPSMIVTIVTPKGSTTSSGCGNDGRNMQWLPLHFPTCTKVSANILPLRQNFPQDASICVHPPKLIDSPCQNFAFVRR